MIRIAINGFGRIGRAAFRAATDYHGLGTRLCRSLRIITDEVEVVAINDLIEGESLASLLKYDSVYGVAIAEIVATAENAESRTENTKDAGSRHSEFISESDGRILKRVQDDRRGETAHDTENYLVVSGKRVRLLSEKDPAKLPWEELGVDVVLECTGVFSDFEKARAHLEAGAKKVIISANAKGDGPTIVLGTESAGQLDSMTARQQQVFSMASCTTNCIAPVMQILKDNFGVEKSLMTTTHAYTSTQNLVDGPNKDLRRARAAAVNAVPTTTGAAKATINAVPELEGRFDGIAVRVPVPCGSLSDIVTLLGKDVMVEEVNKVFKEAAESDEYRGIIEYSEAPLVSSDIIGNPHSAVVDGSFTRVVGGNLVKILAWYDNEWAYGCRLVELSRR